MAEGDPTLAELASRVAALEQQEIDVEDIPMAKLQRKLEQKWTPDAAVLLQPHSITSDLLDSKLGFGGTAGSWEDLTLQNGWTVYNSVPPKCLVLGNVVYLRGEISSGTTTGGTAMLTLPVGRRPATRGNFTGWGSTGPHPLVVTASGVVQWWGTTAVTGLNLGYIAFPLTP